MVTMKDIAELTGVSISTVSRVLHNKGNISEKVRKKVLSACEELTFNKGIVAQSTAVSKFNIALILPFEGEFFNNDPNTSYDIRMIKSTLESQGHIPKIYYPPIKVEQLIKDNIDGIILSDPLTSANTIEYILKSELPYIITNGVYRDKPLFQIDYDNFSGMKSLTKFVIEKGHKNLLLLAGPKDHLVVKNRIDGFLSQINNEVKYSIIYGDFSLNSGYSRTKELIKNNKIDNISCIMALSDYIAIGTIRALTEAKIKIPDNISVTGFDNIEVSAYTNPPLTTVNRVSDGFAFYVINSLIDRITKNLDLSTSNTFFNAKIIERASIK